MWLVFILTLMQVTFFAPSLSKWQVTVIAPSLAKCEEGELLESVSDGVNTNNVSINWQLGLFFCDGQRAIQRPSSV